MKANEFLQATGIESYYALLRRLVALDQRYRYTYMPSAEFGHLIDIRERNRVYWFEILERAHCASIAALVRLERWLDAMKMSAEVKNFLGFAASFRGLLESAADTRYALGDVPKALASIFAYAGQAVRGEATAVVLAPDLENDLIHFSHARKLKSAEEAPESHAARTVREYVTALEGAETGPLHECYAHRCNITHPAADSVLYLLEKERSGAICFREEPDEVAIRDLCERGAGVVACAVGESILYPLMTLRILNRLCVSGLRTAAADEVSLEHVSAWREIEDRLNGK